MKVTVYYTIKNILFGALVGLFGSHAFGSWILGIVMGLSGAVLSLLLDLLLFYYLIQVLDLMVKGIAQKLGTSGEEDKHPLRPRSYRKAIK